MDAAAESFLAEMFPANPHRARVLRACNGNVEQAVQRLLQDEATNAAAADASSSSSSAAAASAAAPAAATAAADVVELSLNPSFDPSFPTPSAPPAAEVNVSLEPVSQGESESNDDLLSPWMPSIDCSPVPSLDPAAASSPPPHAIEPAADDRKESESEIHANQPRHDSIDDQMQQMREQEEEEQKGQHDHDHQHGHDEAHMIDLAANEHELEVDADAALHSAFVALHSLLSASPAVQVATYVTTLRTLLHAVSNVLLHPLTEKFRLLPVGHAKFRAKVGGTPADPRLLGAAQSVLEALGFTNISAAGAEPTEEAFLLMTDESREEARLQRGKTMIEQEILMVQNQTMAARAAAAASAAPASAAPAAAAGGAAAAASSTAPAAAAAAASSAPAPPLASSSLYMPLSQLKKQYKRKPVSTAPAKTAKLTREQMADKINQRLTGKPPEAAAASSAPVVPQRAGRIMDLTQTAKLRAEINEVRRHKHSKWTATAQSRKRVFTVDDLAKMEEDDIKARSVFGAAGAPAAAGAGAAGGGTAGGSKFRTVADFGAGSPADCLALGKEMLRLTNLFRAREGKRALMWHQSLCDIGMVHSKRMGLKQVAFGHDGAQQRFASYPFHARASAENVAWSLGHPNVASCHVDGWIHSPGHRRNMLAHHNWCAIAVWKNPEGAYYSTQLFGLG